MSVPRWRLGEGLGLLGLSTRGCGIWLRHLGWSIHHVRLRLGRLAHPPVETGCRLAGLQVRVGRVMGERHRLRLQGVLWRGIVIHTMLYGETGRWEVGGVVYKGIAVVHAHGHGIAGQRERIIVKQGIGGAISHGGGV
jgi:hypothetical protein